MCKDSALKNINNRKANQRPLFPKLLESSIEIIIKINTEIIIAFLNAPVCDVPMNIPSY